jgi:hypothetical protein
VFIIGYCPDEDVADGKKTASSVVICRPNTHPSMVPYMKAVSSPDKITLTTVAHAEAFLDESKVWLGVLETHSKNLKAKALAKTLRTMVAYLRKKSKKKLENGTKQQTPELVTTEISVKEAGLVLSNEYFVDEDWVLEMLPLPYEYKHSVAGKDFVYAESMVIWIACVDKTEIEVDEADDVNKDESCGMGLLEKLMKGTSI